MLTFASLVRDASVFALVNAAVNLLLFRSNIPGVPAAIFPALGVFFLTLFILLRKNLRFLKLLWSGWMGGCYYTFSAEENRKVCLQAKKCFKYLGVTGDTFSRDCVGWVQNLPPGSPLEFHLLLMNHQANALPTQEAHKLNLDPGHPDVAAQVKLTQARIHTTLMELKGLDLYRRGRLKIRLYDEFIPWWLYIFDGRVAFVGILERGKDGRQSPVMTLKKHPQYGSPFEAFQSTWERLWNSATPV